VNYTATVQGKFGVRGQLMQAGGVFGTYFENDDLSDHGTDTLGVATESKPFQRMDATIDFNWLGVRPVPAPSMAMKKDIGPNYFSARWQGMINPLFSEVYTFSTMVDDGAKLWINGLLIIDQW
jgi:mannan endo-1,4-beta-mannosidase